MILFLFVHQSVLVLSVVVSNILRWSCLRKCAPRSSVTLNFELSFNFISIVLARTTSLLLHKSQASQYGRHRQRAEHTRSRVPLTCVRIAPSMRQHSRLLELTCPTTASTALTNTPSSPPPLFHHLAAQSFHAFSTPQSTSHSTSRSRLYSRYCYCVWAWS